jgi:stage V sporulation protein R
MSKKIKPLFSGSEWTFKHIQHATEVIEDIARTELGLDLYPNQIEIIDSDGMLDAYCSNGLPLMYKHWSFGKHFLHDSQSYKKGHKNLAYEIVINSNPCISYLMAENSMTMQTLVISHACVGHNHFFKNNYLFREWTDASSIVDYLVFARNFISKCEERYGFDAVERVLDACHTIQHYGVDRFKRPKKLSLAKEREHQEDREEYIQRTMNDLWRTIPKKEDSVKENQKVRYPEEPQENILYWIEKKSPVLANWEREIVRIVRKLGQYYYPQRQTKVLNEGFATYVHYDIMNRLWEKGLITDGSYMEFIHSHTNVVMQLPFDHKYYSGVNPYALGFDMLQDIKRICTNPTAEDEEWFPDLIGQNFNDVLLDIVANYRDESFINQFLSPTMMRKWHLFQINDNTDKNFYEISAIHNEQGFKSVRSTLAKSYDIANIDPDIQVWDVDLRGDRTLYLRHNMKNGIQLNKDTEKVLRHIAYLWGYSVKLESVDPVTNRIDRTYSVTSERIK